MLLIKGKSCFTLYKGKNMIIKGYIRIVMLVICFGSIFSGLNASIITLINDSNGPIRVINKSDESNESSFDIRKKHRYRFVGPYFDVFVPRPKGHSFKLLYRCKQNESSKNGIALLNFSDLESGEGAAELFTVAKSEGPHTSMVSGLPMIQKKICLPCREKRE